MKSKWSIEARYNRRVFWINFRYRRKLVALWIAGRLVRLAFRISPDLRKEMGLRK